MINSGQRSSLKLDRQNTKHRLCSPPPPSPHPPSTPSWAAASLTKSSPQPLSSLLCRLCRLQAAAIAGRAAITEPSPPTPLLSCRRPRLVTATIIKPPSPSSCRLTEWCIIYLGGSSALTPLTPLLGLMLRRSSSGTIASEKQRHFLRLI